MNAAREVARRRGSRLYLAGGVVRDLLSRRPIQDVDLVVEESPAAFARELAQGLGASLRLHDRFGTAALTLANGSGVDVAATRREVYRASGALPTVALGASIEEDLARRDFSVNAMALELAPGRRLVDPFGGRNDLARGIIRALHDRSFLDDPTRAFRAVRYANRFGFRIAAATRRAIARALRERAFAGVSGDRLRREIVKIFAEPNRANAVRGLQGVHLAGVIEPRLARAAAGPRLRLAEALAATRTSGVGWLCYLLTWMSSVGPGAAARVAKRLELSGKDRERLLAWHRTRRRLGTGLGRRKSSEIARRISGLSDDEIVAAAAALPPADRRALLAGCADLERIRLSIRGSDLLSAGIPPGESIGEALRRTLDARRDGEIAAREELDYALRAARRRMAGR